MAKFVIQIPGLEEETNDQILQEYVKQAADKAPEEGRIISDEEILNVSREDGEKFKYLKKFNNFVENNLPVVKNYIEKRYLDTKVFKRKYQVDPLTALNKVNLKQSFEEQMKMYDRIRLLNRESSKDLLEEFPLVKYFYKRVQAECMMAYNQLGGLKKVVIQGENLDDHYKNMVLAALNLAVISFKHMLLVLKRGMLVKFTNLTFDYLDDEFKRYKRFPVIMPIRRQSAPVQTANSTDSVDQLSEFENQAAIPSRFGRERSVKLGQVPLFQDCYTTYQKLKPKIQFFVAKILRKRRQLNEKMIEESVVIPLPVANSKATVTTTSDTRIANGKPNVKESTPKKSELENLKGVEVSLRQQVPVHDYLLPEETVRHRPKPPREPKKNVKLDNSLRKKPPAFAPEEEEMLKELATKEKEINEATLDPSVNSKTVLTDMLIQRQKKDFRNIPENDFENNELEQLQAEMEISSRRKGKGPRDSVELRLRRQNESKNGISLDELNEQLNRRKKQVDGNPEEMEKVGPVNDKPYESMKVLPQTGILKKRSTSETHAELNVGAENSDGMQNSSAKEVQQETNKVPIEKKRLKKSQKSVSFDDVPKVHKYAPTDQGSEAGDFDQYFESPEESDRLNGKLPKIKEDTTSRIQRQPSSGGSFESITNYVSNFDVENVKANLKKTVQGWAAYWFDLVPKNASDGGSEGNLVHPESASKSQENEVAPNIQNEPIVEEKSMSEEEVKETVRSINRMNSRNLSESRRGVHHNKRKSRRLLE